MESDWSSYLDLNTFLRHFLVGELSGNIDTYWSVFMYKQRLNDTIYTGPVWDFDLAFNNDGRIRNPNDMSDYVYRSGGSCAGNMRSFVDKIIINTESTKDQLLTIWDEARHNGIDQEHLVAFVDSMEEELLLSQKLNFLRWPIMNRIVHQNPRIWGSYEAEVENVRDFIRKRVEWMDNRLGYTYVPESISTISDSDPDDIDFSRPYSVYSLSGQTLGADLQALPTGIYIVRQGPLVKKVQIR
jgi:spore coat protein CotH